jgi:hypothetical protein
MLRSRLPLERSVKKALQSGHSTLGEDETKGGEGQGGRKGVLTCCLYCPQYRKRAPESGYCHYASLISRRWADPLRVLVLREYDIVQMYRPPEDGLPDVVLSPRWPAQRWLNNHKVTYGDIGFSTDGGVRPPVVGDLERYV